MNVRLFIVKKFQRFKGSKAQRDRGANGQRSKGLGRDVQHSVSM